MKSSNIEQPVTHNHSRSSDPQALASQQRKLPNHLAFSPKFYQSHELEIAEEYEQAVEANSLEQITMLLNKVLELNEDN